MTYLNTGIVCRKMLRIVIERWLRACGWRRGVELCERRETIVEFGGWEEEKRKQTRGPELYGTSGRPVIRKLCALSCVQEGGRIIFSKVGQ